jgi:transcription termination factor Rho
MDFHLPHSSISCVRASRSTGEKKIAHLPVTACHKRCQQAESAMRIFALTGGIASGKSTVCRLLRELCPSVTIFDCDFVTRRLHSDPAVVEQCRTLFGDAAIFAPKNCLDRDFLRKKIFDDAEAKAQLEGILHPLIRQECHAALEEARAAGESPLFIADVPLLFENQFHFGQEKSLLVASSHETQVRRLRNRTRLDDDAIHKIIAAQMQTEEKIRMADVVFWNEGPLTGLRTQIARFLESQGIETTDHDVIHAKPVILPASIHVNEFRQKSLAELHDLAESIPGMALAHATKSELVYDLLQFFANEGVELTCEGVLELGKENFAMLRDPARSFRAQQDDIHVPLTFLRELGLQSGQRVKLLVRAPKEKDKFLTTASLLEVEGKPIAEWQAPTDFDRLTPLFPDRRVYLEGPGPDFLSVRLVDLIAPLGLGQRALIVAPPRGGKTILLKQMAKAIRANHPQCELIVLLLDERPEEVTDFEETVGCTVYASTFDETPRRHAQVADLVLDRSKRLVEQGKDVILLLDSLTRLARGHNAAQGGGPIGSGGVSPVALQKSRKFFGAARNVEEGGSLTILATALIETESRMDDVIFEEFKGTGNMEIRLDRELAERRVYPAIHIPQSGTRNDDRLYHPDEFAKVLEIRRQLAQLPYGEAVQVLMSNLKATQNNAELLLRGIR